MSVKRTFGTTQCFMNLRARSRNKKSRMQSSYMNEQVIQRFSVTPKTV
jgi:hypothetical protein